MHHSEPHSRIEEKISQLEQRLASALKRLENERSLASGSADGEPPGPATAGPMTREARPVRQSSLHGDSLFEVLLEHVVQGYSDRNGDAETISTRLAGALEEDGDMVCIITPTGIIDSANPSLSDRLGYTSVSDGLDRRELVSVVDTPYRSNLSAAIEHATTGTGPTGPIRPEDVVVMRLIGADESRISVAAIIVPTNLDGDRLAVVMRDLSVHQGILEELQESRDNYDALSETITEAILRINEDMQIVFANSAVRTTFGFAPEELRDRPFSMLFPESVYERNEAEFRKYFFVDDADRRRIGMENTVEILGRHKNRGVAPMEVSFGNSKEYRGRTLTCIVRDITLRKNVERRLKQLAYHDQLTGLGNRDLFESDMQHVFATPEVFETGYAALMFLDLDGFKQVNDTIGHDAGDQLLVETAARLRKTLRENDAVYRFGGDEFVVLLRFVHDRKGASVVANNILGEVRRPFELKVSDDSVTSAGVGVSIGIAIIPSDGATIAAVTKAADLAMYSAKESGKNQYAFYDPRLDERAFDRWKLEQGIRTALEQQEFRMHYQALVNGRGEVSGVEALLRWSSPLYGSVAPNRFMPIAEETGMIVPLGGWAIETAFRDAAAWPEVNGAPLFVSVNLSPKQFERSDLLDSIGRVIHRTGIDPARIILEITETCVMTAPERSIATLEALKERYPGLSVAIDDFGTGYSSLSYLTRLPTDIIKIDLSFVSNLFEMSNEKTVGAIINLGHSLGLRIIAEGVETAEQFAYFADKNCFAFQGYHFHRPVPAPEIARIIS